MNTSNFTVKELGTILEGGESTVKYALENGHVDVETARERLAERATEPLELAWRFEEERTPNDVLVRDLDNQEWGMGVEAEPVGDGRSVWVLYEDEFILANFVNDYCAETGMMLDPNPGATV